MSLQLMVVLMFCACCVVYLANKKIAAEVYKKSLGDVDGKKSPYGLVQLRSTSGKWGFSITKDERVIRDSSGTASVYADVNDALEVINVFESLEGYKLSKIQNS